MSAATVVGLFRKPEVPGEHGLPKSPVGEVRVTAAGVDGDYNRYRQEERRGDPDMALLLLTDETLDGLRRDGWPARPGDLGENILLRGLPDAAFAPDRRFALGAVEVEVSKACLPCTNLFALPYVGADRGPEFLRTVLHRRGWYARVRVSGSIRVGDPARPLP